MTLLDCLDHRLGSDASRCVVVDGEKSYSFADLSRHAAGLAADFRERGLGPGDVVSMQLPNWYEALPIMLATAMTGCVLNPIVPIYRDAEVGFILRDASTRLFVIPESFRSFDFLAMARRLAATGAPGAAVATVRGSPQSAEHLSFGSGSAARELSSPRGKDDPWLLMYTSGTTGRAKGVLHSSSTLTAELEAMADYWQVTADDVILMPSPLTHITGYLCGYELPLRTGARVVLMDRWDAAAAVDLIERHGVTMVVAATPFLTELVDQAEARATDLPSLRLFPCGGAPVAPDLINRAHRVLRNCLATRVYGSTEAPTITLGVQSRQEARAAAETEGKVVGHDIRLRRVDGSDAAPGEEGEVVTRSAELFIGYLNPEDEAGAFTPDGFFRTGDLARYDEAGMLVITGRKKDLIIRGGENIAPKEIEDVLLGHPGIVEAAVVAAPSARLGEVPWAFVVARQSDPIDEVAFRAHVAAAGLARQKWPERYVAVASLPRTAAGKVRKDLLRADAADLAAIQ